MRDFDWHDELYCVVKEDGTFAGVPCRTFEEAIQLRDQHKGSKIFDMILDNESVWDYDPYEDIRSWERMCEKDLERMSWELEQEGL